LLCFGTSVLRSAATFLLGALQRRFQASQTRLGCVVTRLDSGYLKATSGAYFGGARPHQAAPHHSDLLHVCFRLRHGPDSRTASHSLFSDVLLSDTLPSLPEPASEGILDHVTQQV
jgi:hypothetical protein